MQVSIILQRRLSKKTNKDTLRANLRKCVERSLQGNRGRNWNGVIAQITEPVQEGEVYVFSSTIYYKSTKEGPQTEEKLPQIVARLSECCSSGPYVANPWIVTSPAEFTEEGRRQTASQPATIRQDDRPIGEVNLEVDGQFDRIFNRSQHVRLIMDAARLAVETNYHKRVHTLLYGKPGCGKTEIMKALSEVFGQEQNAYLWFDATSMTQAGAIRELMEAPFIPPFLFVEEIEKVQENVLRFLLSIMDDRGEIRRLNARVGNQQRSARLVVIATANDIYQLKSLMSGAILSRFQNKIHCSPPDREMMKMILHREITEVNGKEDWIEPVLQFAFDELKARDPRTIISHCLLGRDRLLTGEYQADKKAVMSDFDYTDLAEYMIEEQKKNGK